MEEHQRLHENQALWQNLAIGSEITVIKLDPGGAVAARYPAVVVALDAQDSWLALQATWTYTRVEIDGLVFEQGDALIEWFSPHLPFNAFAVISPAGDLRGWYANVTYPAYVEHSRENPGELTLVWHDLYLDLIGLTNNAFVVRDEDELDESGLETSAPRLHAAIVAAIEDLKRRFGSDQMPFRLPTGSRVIESSRRESQE